MQIPHFFLNYFMLLIASTFVITGLYLSSRGEEERMPDGTILRTGMIFRAWYFFWMQKKPKFAWDKYWYGKEELQQFLFAIKGYLNGIDIGKPKIIGAEDNKPYSVAFKASKEFEDRIPVLERELNVYIERLTVPKEKSVIDFVAPETVTIITNSRNISETRLQVSFPILVGGSVYHPASGEWYKIIDILKHEVTSEIGLVPYNMTEVAQPIEWGDKLVYYAVSFKDGILPNVGQDNVLLAVAREEPTYYFPWWIRKMLAGCITCHASVYGTIIFVLFHGIFWHTLRTEMYGAIANSALIPVIIFTWIAYTLSLAYTLTFAYKKV